MSNILKNATNHFRTKIGGEMLSVEVPEWDATIYFKNTNSLKEEGQLIKLAQKGETVEALVETLLIKAKDKDGKRLFVPADKTVFMNEVDPDVIIRVVGEINTKSRADDFEEVVKN